MLSFTPWQGVGCLAGVGSSESRGQNQNRESHERFGSRQYREGYNDAQADRRWVSAEKIAVENRGFEPLTSAVRSQRSTN